MQSPTGQHWRRRLAAAPRAAGRWQSAAMQPHCRNGPPFLRRQPDMHSTAIYLDPTLLASSHWIPHQVVSGISHMGSCKNEEQDYAGIVMYHHTNQMTLQLITIGKHITLYSHIYLVIANEMNCSICNFYQYTVIRFLRYFKFLIPLDKRNLKTYQ